MTQVVKPRAVQVEERPHGIAPPPGEPPAPAPMPASLTERLRVAKLEEVLYIRDCAVAELARRAAEAVPVPVDDDEPNNRFSLIEI